ncbi:Aspartic proteinase-like protein 2 [Morella rubra]|uniref:Aspartic proteinase-like protein 2 n=1 Tax=Morella rubra TaxID=262757 RepID=A0A6A1W8J3_9ROSI|nr:Aspartic proteinase-like protein 2 [Morella rubra]
MHKSKCRDSTTSISATKIPSLATQTHIHRDKPTGMRGLVPLISVVAAILVSVVYCVLPPSVLPLERTFPLTRRVELDHLRARDRARHARILQGVVDFSVEGSSDPYLGGYEWLYFTKVKLGSPPREFSVQIDTGSDILWVTCSSCSDCPQSSGLGVQLNSFDAASSSTAGLVSCSDPMCSSAFQTAATECSSQNNQCGYSFQYGDGSGTSGYYVSDALNFDMVLGQSYIANSSATVVFGCSTYQSGDLTKTDKAVDGIFGFGQGALSIISQLSSRGITPKVFSHCLKGDGNGGGILVLGEILEPSIVYSPLVPAHYIVFVSLLHPKDHPDIFRPHYNLYLQSIAVNGQLLQIDPTAFATSSNRGTIVDSGTTLTYLVDEAYDPFVSSITAIVQQSASPIISKGNQCYLVSTSVSEIFPPVSLNFAGGASMVLKPEEYLVHLGFAGGAAMWCIGFQRVQEGVTILGDLVLKDKIFVYDLSRQRLGWANYDCSLSVNVSVVSGKEFLNAGQLSVSSSSRDMLFELLPVGIVSLLLHVSVLKQFQIL